MNNTEQLKIAKSYLGKGGATFRKFCGLGSRDPWCNAYVTYIFSKTDNAGLYCNGTKQTYCPNSIKWCYKNLASIPIYLAMPSDVIYFDWERNGVPNHIGFVRERKSCDDIYTIEGNTDGGKVANKIRTAKYVQAVFRPHFKASFKLGVIEVDGKCGYNTIANLQKALKTVGTYKGDIDGILGQQTVKAIQNMVGVKADGLWGNATSKAFQKFLGVTQDAKFCAESVKAMQKWVNRMNAQPKPAPTTNKDKLVSTARSLAWAKGTAKSKYAWKGGSATNEFKTALNKAYPKRSNWSKAPKAGCCCDVFVGTVVRASGLDSKFPRGWDEQIKHKSDKFEKLTYTNANPYSVSKDGDIILYTKNKSGTSKHVLMRGDGVIYEAQYEKTYGHVNADVKKKLNVKRPKVVIFRAK